MNKKHMALQPLQDNAPGVVASFSLINDTDVTKRFAETATFIRSHGLPVF